MSAPAGDRASVSVSVAVEPAVAFEVFTTEVDLWWKHGPAYRVGRRSPGVLTFEPGVGGRLFETFTTAAGPKTLEMGRITVWDPPSRLEFEWRGVNFKGDEKTEVEVRFEHVVARARGAAVACRMRDDGKIDYVELPGSNLPQTKQFYAAAFGWTFVDYGPTYAAMENAGLDGGFQGNPESAPPGPLVVLYAADLEAMLAKVEAAGGVVTAPIFSFPGGRRFHFRDPSGNQLGVWSAS